jgi:hypothetical protein
VPFGGQCVNFLIKINGGEIMTGAHLTRVVAEYYRAAGRAVAAPVAKPKPAVLPLLRRIETVAAQRNVPEKHASTPKIPLELRKAAVVPNGDGKLEAAKQAKVPESGVLGLARRELKFSLKNPFKLLGSEEKTPMAPRELADVLGYKIVDFGGAGNNCLLLAAIGAYGALGDVPPLAEKGISGAEQLRQRVLGEIDGDISTHVANLRDRLESFGITGDEADSLIAQAKSLSTEGIRKEQDKKELSQLRERLVPTIAAKLGEEESSSAVQDDYNSISTLMGKIGDLSLLRVNSTTGQQLFVEAATYVARIFDRDTAIVIGPRAYYFRKDGSSQDGAEGNLADVLQLWKEKYGASNPDRPIILTFSGNDHSGHYMAFVPKAGQ